METVKQFLEILIQLASNKPLSRESFSEDVLDRVKVILALVSFILFAAFVVIFTPDYNRVGFTTALTKQGAWWILIGVIVVSILLLFVFLLLFISALTKYKGEANEERDIIVFKDNEIIGRIIELEKKIGVQYSDSFKFFQKLIKKYNQPSSNSSVVANPQKPGSYSKPYVEFIKDFKTHTNVPLLDLTYIFAYASNSSNSTFKCVIAFDEYFENDPKTEVDETLRMLTYFCCFKKGAEKNRISRVFTIPGIAVDPKTNIGKTKTLFNTPETRKRNKVILKYLLTNQICSIATYLLVYDNADSHVKDEFFALADYVIAISANDSGNKENRIFFAYPKEHEEKEKTISTTDPFILALMDADFDYRLTKLGDPNHSFNIEELNRGNREEIYSTLGFDVKSKEGKREVNAIIDELEKQLVEIQENVVKEFYSASQIKNLLAGYKFK